jgi:hypothetical protein
MMPGFVGLHGELEIFPYVMLLKHRRLLKLSANADPRDLVCLQLSQIEKLTKKDGTAVGHGLSGDNIHHGRFSRAIRTDDTSQFSVIDR